MLLFLESQNGRAHKRSREKVIGHQVLRQYCTSLVKLWGIQRRQGLVLSGNPRTSNVQTWLRTISLEEQARKRLNFEDRASQLHLESTITIKEREPLSTYFLNKKKNKITHGLGMRFAWLGAYSQMLRGESIRGLEFADLLLKEYEPTANGTSIPLDDRHSNSDSESEEDRMSQTSSNSSVKMLICILGKGKTHRDGQAQFGASYRHVDPLLCPIGALALYFFSRFQVDDKEEDQFPDLTDPKKFFNVKVVRAQPGHLQPIDPEKEMTYRAHYRAFKRAYASTGVDSSKATHLCRSGSASTVAQNEAISHEDVRLAGRWDYSVMVKTYLHKLPHPVLRSLAGFNAQVGATCQWSRDIKPPDELLKKIFPFLNRYLIGGCKDESDEEEEETDDEESSEDDSDSESDSDDDEETIRRRKKRRLSHSVKLSNRTAIRLVKLLRHLRMVLLQDVAILKDRYPDHPLFQHPVFQSSPFVQFQEKVLTAHRRSETRTVVVSQTSHPELASLLQSNSILIRELTAMREEARKHQEEEIKRHEILIKTFKQKHHVRNREPRSSSPSDSANNVELSSPSSSLSSVDISTLGKPSLANIKEIPELWKIWTKGSIDFASVEELDSKRLGRISWMSKGYGIGKERIEGKTWRKRYSRMKEIITPIKKKIEESRKKKEKEKKIVRKMEKLRGDWSLDRLSKSLAVLRRRGEEFRWKRNQLENLI